MEIHRKRDFLITVAYWLVILAGVYLAFEYLLPVSVPFLLGILVAMLVVRLSRLIRCPQKPLRLGLIAVIYGVVGWIVVFVTVRGVSALTGIIRWLPEVYELKLLPFAELVYNWFLSTTETLDPMVLSTLKVLGEELLASMESLISFLTGKAVNLVSGAATGVPSLLLSMLAMIFSTVFVAVDYEKIADFAAEHTPQWVKKLVSSIRSYLTDTLFVVIRSYVLIMLLTFTELSILFSLFGIDHALLKAAVIAFLDILPILGTGGIMIPWAIISLVLGYTTLGIELFVIYGIVTVVRNYVEPKIVGAQLGLHPLVTLVSMFIGLRLFGFLGMFGLPVGISFLWKQRQEKAQKDQAEALAEN